MVNNYKKCELFRKKVVENYENKTIKFANVKQIYNVSRGTLFYWNKKFNNSGHIKDRKKESKYNTLIKFYSRNYVLTRIFFRIELLIKNIKRKFNVVASCSSIYEILKKMNIRRVRIKKKNYFIKKARYNALKKELKNKTKYKWKKIVFIDEVSIDTHIIPNYGWSIKGKSINMKHLRYKKRCTLICAINNREVIHYKAITGTSNAITFKEFLNELKEVAQTRNFLLDNARIHKSRIVKEYAEENNINLIFNVPYSPEYNPIERVFSELKNYLRFKRNNNLFSNLMKNVKKCFKCIPIKNIQNYVQKSHDLLFK
jgi:transposase